MKVTKSHSECFKPFVLNISVENEEEARVLNELFGLDQSVPEFLKENGYISNDQRVMLSKLFNQLYQLT